MKKYSFVLFVVFLKSSYSQGIDEYCTLQSTGQTGKCFLLRNCPKAIEDLQKKQIFPQQCGFQGTEPIVCCAIASTSSTTTTTTTTPIPDIENKVGVGDISKRKCKEYGEYVYEVQAALVLLPGDEAVKIDKCAIREVELIVGGEKAKPREFPHMALIGFDGDNGVDWKCGGSLISERFVLTAGHCLYHSSFGYAKFIRLGELVIGATNDDAKPQDFEVTERIYHPGYKAPSAYNDIALLKMNKPAALNIYVRPACLYTSPSPRTEKAIATGWGRTEFTGASSNDLLKVVLEFFTQDQCAKAYKNVPKIRLRNGILADKQICAGSHTEEKDTCQGDSGGPLQVYSQVYCMYDIIGVTSLGKSCGVISSPGVYTKVSNYIGWIESIVWGT